MTARSKRRSLFNCPECGISVMVRDVTASPHSGSFGSVDEFHCSVCGNAFLIETKVTFKSRVMLRPEDAGKPNIHEDEGIINNLF